MPCAGVRPGWEIADGWQIAKFRISEVSERSVLNPAI